MVELPNVKDPRQAAVLMAISGACNVHTNMINSRKHGPIAQVTAHCKTGQIPRVLAGLDNLDPDARTSFADQLRSRRNFLLV